MKLIQTFFPAATQGSADSRMSEITDEAVLAESSGGFLDVVAIDEGGGGSFDPSGGLGFDPAGDLGFDPAGDLGFDPAGDLGFDPAGDLGFDPSVDPSQDVTDEPFVASLDIDPNDPGAYNSAGSVHVEPDPLPPATEPSITQDPQRGVYVIGGNNPWADDGPRTPTSAPERAPERQPYHDPVYDHTPSADREVGYAVLGYALSQAGGALGAVVGGPVGAAVGGALGRWAANELIERADLSNNDNLGNIADIVAP